MTDTLLYPYNLIGVVEAKFEFMREPPRIGTGFMVNNRCVITAAHNIVDRFRADQIARDVCFILSCDGNIGDKGRIKVVHF